MGDEDFLVLPSDSDDEGDGSSGGTRRTRPAMAQSFEAAVRLPEWFMPGYKGPQQGWMAEESTLKYRAELHYARRDYVQSKACALQLLQEVEGLKSNKQAKREMVDLVARASFKLDDKEDAILYAAQRAELDNEADASGHHLLGNILFHYSSCAKALAAYQRVAAFLNSTAEIWFQIARCYIALQGNTDQLYFAWSALLRARAWSTVVRSSLQIFSAQRRLPAMRMSASESGLRRKCRSLLSSFQT
eukprot:m.152190 g.152190  ORF g.152190 m.152190 type:complete len:246 (-) comp16915_c0_seq2:381-1118(-)